MTEEKRRTSDDGASKFDPQSSTAEDLFKSQTVGLVNLADFRKRRAEAVEQKEREAHGQSLSESATPTAQSGTATPRDSDSVTPPTKKKRKKAVAAGKLSFGVEDEENATKSMSARGARLASEAESEDVAPLFSLGQNFTGRLGPDSGVARMPRIMTKSTLAKEAQTREMLRREYLLMQEAVKATDILIPFVFYDGTNIPGGICKIKKGDHIWLFLDKSRKVGADTGVGGKEKSRREWARVGVDDLLLVRGEIIIPHHYDFYHFILNDVQGPQGKLFDYSKRPTHGTIVPAEAGPETSETFNPLSRHRPSASKDSSEAIDDSELEGADQNPTLTKVVDRRWYTRHKHIYPASIWEEYDPSKDYKTGHRKDPEGNTFFFS